MMPLAGQLTTTIPLASLYCFIFWKANFLGKYQKLIRLYSITVQLLFILFFSFFSFYFIRTSNNSDIELFFNGLTFFYAAMLLPLWGTLFFAFHKWRQQMELFKGFRFLLWLSVLTLSLFLTFLGYVLFTFFYYGFAP